MKAVAAALLGALIAAPAAHAQTSDPTLPAFRALYKELVEINTTLSVGSCTEAAEAMSARLKAAGFPESDVRVLVPEGRPKDGNLVAVLKGKDAKAQPLLLLAHIDVVEANRADWERDPFTLVEENGYFYARGASDDKAMAAVITDSLIRYKQAGYKPRRDIKLALTCGEETPNTFNGVSWLIANHPDTLKAYMALNEGAGGRLDAKGKPVSLGIQAGEKVYQDYSLEVTNPGGHSSRPVKDNAIVHLSQALAKIGAYDFPTRINEATRENFRGNGPLVGGEEGAAMSKLAASPADATSIDIVSKDPSRNSMMRTTCVPTQVAAGHATNALPQRAVGNVNCRILPDESQQAVLDQLIKIVGDPAVKISFKDTPEDRGPPPALTPAVLGPAKKVAAKLWPGVPLIPAMATGATDGRFTNAAGTPTYGLTGMFGDPDGGGTHGLNERIRVKSLYDGRAFLHEVTKLYADAPGA